jgi:hypothetical protein
VPAATAAIGGVGVGLCLLASAVLNEVGPHHSLKPLAERLGALLRPDDVLIHERGLEKGGGLLFYTHRQVLVLNGRRGDLEFGSNLPGSSRWFIDTRQFREVWNGRARAFLITDLPLSAARSPRRLPVSRCRWPRLGRGGCTPTARSSESMIALARGLNALVMRSGRTAPRRLLWMIRHFPMPVMNALRQLALRRTVRLAAERSRFYRDKLAASQIDPRRVRSLADLQSCETTPEDLRATAPDDFLCGRPELVVESSGTTGRVTRVYLSHAELEYYARQGAILLALVGAGPDDRILGAFDYAWGLGGIYAQRVGAHSGLFGAFPGLVEPLEAVERLREYRFTIVMGDPFWIARFTEIAMAHGVRPPMKAFVSGAERITENLRGVIEDYWKAPLYMTYASTELGASLGVECPKKTGYHLHEYDYAVRS